MPVLLLWAVLAVIVVGGHHSGREGGPGLGSRQPAERQDSQEGGCGDDHAECDAQRARGRRRLDGAKSCGHLILR